MCLNAALMDPRIFYLSPVDVFHQDVTFLLMTVDMASQVGKESNG